MALKPLRLDRILSHMRVASRSELKKLAKQGRIKVNGEEVLDTSLKFDPSAVKISVDEEIIAYREHFYWMMNKPPGVITATSDQRETTVLDLLDYEDAIFEPFPVGRLDKDTEGLLILTTDGDLAHFLLSPRFQIPKVYAFITEGILPDDAITRCAEGLILEDDTKTLPAVLEIEELNREEGISKGRLTITEGKFHQVKRMLKVFNCEVVFLKRIRFGPLPLDENLETESYRLLSDNEIGLLREAIKRN